MDVLRRVCATVGPVLLALVVLAVAWPTARLQLGVGPAVALAIGLAAALPLLLVGRRPILAWAIAAAATVVVGVAGSRMAPAGAIRLPAMQIVVVLLLLGVVAVLARPWVVAAAGLVTVVEGVAFGYAGPTMVVVVTGAVLGVALLLRGLLTSRRALRAEEELTEAERTRRGVLQERARIARDLHDVVAHSMSMVVVRAETARYRLTDISDATAAEFAALADDARAALGEVRTVLGVLRAEGDDTDPEHRPQPTLDDVDDLVAQTRSAGVPVTFTVTGDHAECGAATAVSVYRILQEALANAARHAAGAPVAVTLDHGPDRVRLRVVHGPGRASTGPGSGLGLTGMRDRAAAVGGELTAGPTPDGGFAVTAGLPAARAVVA